MGVATCRTLCDAGPPGGVLALVVVASPLRRPRSCVHHG